MSRLSLASGPAASSSACRRRIWLSVSVRLTSTHQDCRKGSRGWRGDGILQQHLSGSAGRSPTLRHPYLLDVTTMGAMELPSALLLFQLGEHVVQHPRILAVTLGPL